jgi:hypothetical protein
MLQTPLQQSLFALHALPAVWQQVPPSLQAPPPPNWTHAPLLHALGPLQQGVPPAAQDCPSETHCAPPHAPPVQFRVQHSPGLVQLPEVLHSGCVHWCVASHVPEQHWLPVVQVRPPPRQTTPPPLRSMTLVTLRSMTPLTLRSMTLVTLRSMTPAVMSTPFPDVSWLQPAATRPNPRAKQSWNKRIAIFYSIA